MVFSIKTAVVGSLMAGLALAAPSLSHVSEKRQNENSFTIFTYNHCPEDKTFAIYQVTSDYQMLQTTDPILIPGNGGEANIQAPFQGTGYRLSATADQGTAAQWNAQALFEFGYAGSYDGSPDGTAYDLSVMQGSDPNVGIEVVPYNNGNGSNNCETKICYPDNCPTDQGWTNPNQGPAADTVCYYGPTNFIVVFCP